VNYCYILINHQKIGIRKDFLRALHNNPEEEDPKELPQDGEKPQDFDKFLELLEDLKHTAAYKKMIPQKVLRFLLEPTQKDAPGNDDNVLIHFEMYYKSELLRCKREDPNNKDYIKFLREKLSLIERHDNILEIKRTIAKFLKQEASQKYLKNQIQTGKCGNNKEEFCKKMNQEFSLKL